MPQVAAICRGINELCVLRRKAAVQKLFAFLYSFRRKRKGTGPRTTCCTEGVALMTRIGSYFSLSYVQFQKLIYYIWQYLQDFFKPGVKYRVPMFLATSKNKVVSQTFCRRASTVKEFKLSTILQAPSLFKILFIIHQQYLLEFQMFVRI